MSFIDAKESKMGSILSNTKEAYKVPIYQRPYAWKKDQWEDLFEDIKNLDHNDTHFLGSIVVVPEKKEGPRLESTNYFQVVDGQQRLTTILIWLSVMRDRLNEEGNHELAKDITGTYLFATDYEDDKVINIPKISLAESDYEPFLRVLSGKEKNGRHRIFECYDFFNKMADSSISSNILLNNISIVHINAFSHFNAFRLFETLNDRGLELSAADLIKNFILMKVSNNKEVFTEVISEWNEMYKKIKDLEPVTFIRRYMLSNYKGKISKTKLYEEIKKKLGSIDDNDILNFVQDLNSKASIYKKINERTFSSEKINKLLHELQLIEVSPSYTLLLKVFPILEEDSSEDSKEITKNVIEILKLIEKFHIRWGICVASTSRLDQIYNNICMGLSNIPRNSKRSENYLEFIKETFTKEIRGNADDEVLRSSIISRKFNSTEKRTKYILWKLSEPTGEMVFDVNEVQTEHIMPQNPRKEWLAYLKRNSSKNEEEIKALHKEKLNLIGNLTIIIGEWNQSMSNKLFKDKKSEYAKSDFTLNKNLLNYSQWKFNEIDKRSNELAEKALKIWKWDMKYGGKFDTKEHWIIFIDEEKAREIVNGPIKNRKIFAFREEDAGKTIIKPRDSACFYVSGKGVVAHADIETYAQKSLMEDTGSYLWVCNLKDPKVYFENPIILDKGLREKMDAFKSTKNINNWGWFVSKNHTINEHDFKLMTN
jgi:uncharacterized protein with ParB-like and HNH nuclease domain